MNQPGHEPSGFSTLFDFLPIGAYRATPDGVLLRANPALVRLHGYDTEAQLLAATAGTGFAWHADPAQRQSLRALLEQDGAVHAFVGQARRHPGGERISVRENAHLVRDADGRALYVEGTVEDITEPAHAEACLPRDAEAWSLAFDCTGDGVWDWNIAQGTAAMSARCYELYGIDRAEPDQLARLMDERTHPDDVVQMLRDRQAHLDGATPAYQNEHRVRAADGSWKWVLTRGKVVGRDASGRPLRMVGTHTDITSRKVVEARVWHQANFDTLTGLPNRRMLHDRLSQHLLRSQRDQSQLAVLFIDLDHFKAVNDRLGHDGGDQLLAEAARRLTHCVRASDTVARMGGDEFAVVSPALHHTREVERIVQAILSEMSREFQVGNERAVVTASIGIAFHSGVPTGVDDLLRQADQALYQAKGAGRDGFAYFTPALHEDAQRRADLSNALYQALAEQQLSVHYQPIVDLASGQVHKAEALLRWMHPARGPVGPTEFVPIAEANGSILEIGEWVFTQAARQAIAWRGSLHPQFQISVNKSPAQFHRTLAARERWLRKLANLQLPPQAVTVEITEGLLLDPDYDVAQHLQALRAAGVCTALDDFGTGYSSLAYLQRYDIDYLKIDQSFVHGLAPDSNELALCKAMIVMAKQLNIQVIAEGIETAQQRDLLADAGCTYGQGFLFAPALPADGFEGWLAQRGG